MMNVERVARLRAAMAHPNVQAMTRVVREKESRQDEAAYTLISGGSHFYSFTDHPYHGQRSPPGRAAGVAQYLASTWAGVADRIGATDFSPPWQELGFVDLFDIRHALDDIIAGRIPEAIAKLVLEWTSLPGAAENRAYTLEHALAVFTQWGGTLAGVATQRQPDTTQDPAPIEDRSTEASAEDAATARTADNEGATVATEPTLKTIATGAAGVLGNILLPGAGSLIAGLASSLIDAFSPLAKEKLTKLTGDAQVAGTLTTALVETAKKVTGQADAIAAVAAARGDPAALAQIEAEVLSFVAQLGPLADKVAGYEQSAWSAEEDSRDRASARAAAAPPANDQDTFLTRAIVALVVVALVGLGAGVLTLAVMGKPYGELLTLFAGLLGIVSAKFGTRYDNRYGSSRGSEAKDFIIGEVARRQPGGKS